MKKFLPTCLALVLIAISTTAASAQDLNFTTLFTFEPARITTAPRLGDVDVAFPDAARKNGVEGTAKVKFVLGRDGRIHGATIVADIGFGVGDAVKAAVERLTFTPASFNGTPVDIATTLSYEVTAYYDEFDKDISKVKLVGKPTAEYPSQFRSDGTKGKVRVAILFFTDGKVKVRKVDSTMPPEFDAAAEKAAAALKFEPAIHKKSKRPVNMTMWVTFEFKP